MFILKYEITYVNDKLSYDEIKIIVNEKICNIIERLEFNYYRENGN